MVSRLCEVAVAAVAPACRLLLMGFVILSSLAAAWGDGVPAAPKETATELKGQALILVGLLAGCASATPTVEPVQVA